MQLQIHRHPVFPAQVGLHILMEGTLLLVVHLLQQAQGAMLRSLTHKREGSGLCQGIFRLVDLTVDGQDMGIQTVSHQTDTTHRQHIVDVPHVTGHLLILLLQLLHVVLQFLVRTGHLCDITSRTIDTQQLVLTVAQGHDLQLIIHQVALQELIQWTLVIGIIAPEQLGHIDIVQVLQVEVVHAHNLLDRDLHLPDFLHIHWHGRLGFLVHVIDIAVLVVRHHVDHG